MKKISILILLVAMTLTSAHSRTCVEVYQERIEDASLYPHAGWAFIPGFAIGSPLAAYFTTASVFVPHMVATGAITSGLVLATGRVKSTPYRKAKNLIIDAYEYKLRGIKGRMLKKYERRLNRNLDEDISTAALVDEIITRNEDLSLCEDFNSYKEIKRVNLFNEFECSIRVPGDTSKSLLRSLRRKYMKLGFLVHDNHSVGADYEVSNIKRTKRVFYTSKEDLQVDTGYYIVKKKRDFSTQEYVTKRKESKLNKYRKIKKQKMRIKNKKVLKKIVENAYNACMM